MTDFEYSVRVRYAETDAMGVVHHRCYFVWLESARIEWLRSLGLDYKGIEKEGFYLPVVEVSLKYHAPSFFDDIIRIVLTPQNDPVRSRFTLYYKCFREDTLLAQGFTVHAFVNAERKLMKPPAFFLEKVGGA